jgi:hypothetical protein
MNKKAEFTVKILKEYVKENQVMPRSTSDLSRLEEWLIMKIFTVKNLSLSGVSKFVTAKDLKCPRCKKHALMQYFDGKECTSCGYVC